MSSALSKVWHHKYFKPTVAIIIIVGIILGAFFSLRIVLNTDTPIRVVESGSMSLPLNYITGPPRPYTLNDFLATLEHPFDRTLDTGDIIIIQKVDPKNLNTNYPNSDIIVYKNPTKPSDTPIVHRIVAVDNINSTLYFQTKGDGNGQKWPLIPTPSMYDSNTIYNGHGQGVPQDLVEGKVILRIPWFGWITLFLKENSLGLPIIITLIILLVVAEFIIPVLREKKVPQQETQIKNLKIKINQRGQKPVPARILWLANLKKEVSLLMVYSFFYKNHQSKEKY
jgi:signal peptidase I